MEHSPSASLKKTALAQAHVKAGGRMIEFGGWWMPVQYSSILEEHAAVRKSAGLFDISHMGEVIVSGTGAKEWLNSLFTNDVNKVAPGHGQYSLMLNEKGGVIDDLILYCLEPDYYLVIINASKIDEDWDWMQKHLPSQGVKLENKSDEMAGLALQGPNSESVLNSFLGKGTQLPVRYEIRKFTKEKISLQIARTGYTGEDGFELFFPASEAEKIWDGLLEVGKDLGLKPCGLGARDTLRLEMCYPLNGNDLMSTRTPLEAGLGIFVSLDKSATFPGKEILQQQKKEGVREKLVAFRMTGKGAPPRSHYPLYAGTKKIGEVTSGCLSPSLNYGIGMGYIASPHAAVDQQIEVEIRGTRLPAIIVKKPFYKKL